METYQFGYSFTTPMASAPCHTSAWLPLTCPESLRFSGTAIMMTTALIASLVFTPSIYGRIGESKEQCDARYGLRVRERDGGNEISYRRLGIDVRVKFDAGYAYSITYSTEETESKEDQHTLTSADIAKLIDLNCPGLELGEPFVSIDAGMLWTIGAYTVSLDGRRTWLSIEHTDTVQRRQIIGPSPEPHLPGF